MRQTKQKLAELRGLLNRDHTLNGAMICGLDGYIVEAQARAMSVQPHDDWRDTSISGMARGAIAESTTRIAGAFAKLKIPPPPVEIQINLTPADLPKTGASLDLPIAILMLQAAGVLPDLPEHMEGDFVIIGEVGLHGEIRRVPGALSMAYAAKPGQALIVPTGNERECSLILAKKGHEGCRIYGVSTLEEVIEFFQGKRKLEPSTRDVIKYDDAIAKAVDFSLVRGQQKAKDAAIIAAAGGHNLLLIGPPGEGKSLLASAMPGILPRLSPDEKVLLTKIYSACGKLERDGEAVTRRPFRTIHHTASKPSIVGGGSGTPRPGEATLAHLGVLFLDEIAEFSRSTLETMRQPIENGEIVVSRVGGTFTYPCRFGLVAAMNPCPCGYYPADTCECNDRDISAYHKKLSGPLLDRIDLQVEMTRLTTEERFTEKSEPESPRIRARVEAAREMQKSRFEGLDVPFNAAIPGGRVRELCYFSEAGFEEYKNKVEKHSISTRSMDRLAKVSRTIADLQGAEQIQPSHVNSAASFVIGGLLRSQF